MKLLLANWHQFLPLAGIGVAVLIAGYFLLRKREQDPREIERQRRLYLNRIGRIVEGQVLEIVDADKAPDPEPARGKSKDRGGATKAAVDGASKLLYYTYSISGVTYETAQDITGLEERLCLDKAVIGQAASVKYDPSNPSNSILIADDWSGLH
ncbi:MAG: hypothetical protein WA755_06655 [Candidatus Acidiferrales bacterium]